MEPFCKDTLKSYIVKDDFETAIRYAKEHELIKEDDCIAAHKILERDPHCSYEVTKAKVNMVVIYLLHKADVKNYLGK